MERFFVGENFGDWPVGLFLVKGESVVLIGEVDELRDKMLPNRIDEKDIEAEFKKVDRERRSIRTNDAGDSDLHN